MECASVKVKQCKKALEDWRKATSKWLESCTGNAEKHGNSSNESMSITETYRTILKANPNLTCEQAMDMAIGMSREWDIDDEINSELDRIERMCSYGESDTTTSEP